MMRLVIAIGLSLGMQATAWAQEAARTAADDLNALPTARIAAMLLPADLAQQAATHSATPPDAMAPPPRREADVAHVAFQTAASLNTVGICRRESYQVSAERAKDDGTNASFAPTGRMTAFIQVRLGPDCQTIGAGFATIQGGAISEGDASRMILRLEALRRDARAGRRLDVQVECTTDFSHYECPRRTDQLVAELPLEGAYLFSRSYDQRHDLLLAATETTPGNLFWEIRFTEHPEPVLHLKRRIPPPF